MKYISGKFLSKLQYNLIGELKLVKVSDENKILEIKEKFVSKTPIKYCVTDYMEKYNIEVFNTIENQSYDVNEVLLIRINKTQVQDFNYNWTDLDNYELITDNFYELRKDNRYDYMMLDRLRTDCEYFLSYGSRSINSLWANSVEGQIEEMRRLWHSFLEDEKPEWLTLEKIDEYQKNMLD